MKNQSELKPIVNKYVEWVRNGAATLREVLAEVNADCFLENNEKAFIRHWVKLCVTSGKYL
jgi:hypothetical protein